MIEVETEIEPPGLDPEEPDEPPEISVTVWLNEADGTRRQSAVWGLPPDATDEQLADALIAALRGAAANRGPGLAAAVERRIR